MPPLSEVQDLQANLVDLNTLAARDLTGVWRNVSDLDAVAARDVMIAATPEVVAPYRAAAGELSASWYDSNVAAAGFRATPAAPVAAEQVAASVRWSMGPAFTSQPASPLALLAGSVQRMVFGGSRDTLIGNAAREGVRYARYASSTACPFCRMLVTRGFVYTEDTAEFQAHDNCRCMAVPDNDDSYQPPDYVEQWQQQYVEASKNTNGSTTSVLTYWNKNLL